MSQQFQKEIQSDGDFDFLQFHIVKKKRGEEGDSMRGNGIHPSIEISAVFPRAKELQLHCSLLWKCHISWYDKMYYGWEVLQM